MHVSFYIGLVFLGCCSNVVFLELLTNKFPGSGNIITFAQFLFISIKGFIFEAKFGTKKSKIPISKYMTLVVIFFIVSILNNYALNFNISMPLHMIFRSGSLISNMFLGVIILKKKYSFREYFSILLITVGICICTMASSKEITKQDQEDTKNDYINFLWWIIGILMLTASLLLSGLMGIIQEKLYKQFGKHPDEALYYNHVLTLPAFAFFFNDLINQCSLFNQSEKIDLIFLSIPIVWLFLMGNTLTQYLCISSVFVLTTECTSLAVNLVVTLRKFISLIISIIYFQNPFTLLHWFGTLFVFGGTILFTDLIGKFKDSYLSKEKKTK